MSLSPLFQWLATTNGSIALHESLYMYPLVESTHVLTLCVFVGLSAIVDLRLMGVSFKSVPVSELVARLLPWMQAGFVVMMVTGALLFYAIPIRTYHNIFFRAKILLLVLAGVNAWVFHAKAYRRVFEWDTAPVTPRAARIGGAASLVLWAFIIVFGRMIAYNWFDCDVPQSRLVVALGGCEAYPRE